MSNPIDVQLLRSLRDGQRGIHWLQNLARANVRRSDGGPFEQVYGLAAEIDRLDGEIQETYTLDKFFYRLPRAWWVWVPLLYLGGFLLAAQAELYEDRLIRWMWSLIIFGGFALTFLAKKAAKEGALKHAKVLRRPRLMGERAALMVQLMETRDQVVEAAVSSLSTPS